MLLVQRHLLDGVALDRLQRLHTDVAPLAGDVPAPDGLVNPGDLLVIRRMALGL